MIRSVGLGSLLDTAARKIWTRIRRTEIFPVEHVIDSELAFDGKVALIAGGSGGIGIAVARSLLASGGTVILGGTSQDKLDQSKSALGVDRVGTVIMDVRDVSGIASAIAESIDLFGRIDIFIWCSGIHTEDVDFWTISPTEFDRIMSVNIRGAFFACQEVGQYMIDAGLEGHILLVNSSRGFEPAWSPYGISKWGLRGLTEGLAQILLPHGIVVNGVAPGPTATSLVNVTDGDSIRSLENGLGRLAVPSEIADWVKMLVGPSGDMVVGETVLVSGGRGGIDIR